MSRLANDPVAFTGVPPSIDSIIAQHPLTLLIAGHTHKFAYYANEKQVIVGNRGLFLTERIPPGTYEVHAEGYAPLTPEQERRSGLVTATLTAQATVKVPESGVVPSLKLELKKPAAAAKRYGISD